MKHSSQREGGCVQFSWCQPPRVWPEALAFLHNAERETSPVCAFLDAWVFNHH
jgi:hypothetical protein